MAVEWGERVKRFQSALNFLSRNTANSCKQWHFRQVIHHYVFYMSPTSQNELIGIATKYTFQKWLFLQTKLLVYMSVYICVCIYMCVHMYICIYVYFCTFMYIWTTIVSWYKDNVQVTSTLTLFHIYIYTYKWYSPLKDSLK